MDDNYYMNLALIEAKKAFDLDEVPIGCIIVFNNKVIASSFNHKTLDNVATYHAEILAIEKACKYLGTWYLDNCVLYTTVEPCMMCTGAIIQSRIPKVVYGTTNETFGQISRMDTKIDVIGGVLEQECSAILTKFFQLKRNENR